MVEVDILSFSWFSGWILTITFDISIGCHGRLRKFSSVPSLGLLLQRAGHEYHKNILKPNISLCYSTAYHCPKIPDASSTIYTLQTTEFSTKLKSNDITCLIYLTSHSPSHKEILAVLQTGHANSSLWLFKDSNFLKICDYCVQLFLLSNIQHMNQVFFIRFSSCGFTEFDFCLSYLSI
jgi:hypothetical protein